METRKRRLKRRYNQCLFRRKQLLKKTLLGVLSTVLVFWLTTALYSWFKDRSNRQDSAKQGEQGKSDALPTYYFDGLVVDEATKSLLSGAEVKLMIGEITTSDKTDSEGKYLFSVPKAGHQIAAIFVASAAGYRAYTKNLKSDPSGVLESVPTVFLQAESQPSPSSPSPSTAPVVRMTGKWTEATRYTPRALPTAARIAVQAVKP
jgi:hypothetical protein